MVKVAPGQNALGSVAEVGQKQEGPHSPTQVSTSLWLWSATPRPLLAWPGRPPSCLPHFLPVLWCLALCFLLPAGLPAALAPPLSWRRLSWCDVKLFCVIAVRAPQAGARSSLWVSQGAGAGQRTGFGSEHLLFPTAFLACPRRGAEGGWTGCHLKE